MPRQNGAQVRLRTLDLPPRWYPPQCLYAPATGSIYGGIQVGSLDPATVFRRAVGLGTFGCRHLKLICHLPGNAWLF
jgi:hypothetical protein